MINILFDGLVILGYIIGVLIFFTGVVAWIFMLFYIFIFQPVEEESPYSKKNRSKFEVVE